MSFTVKQLNITIGYVFSKSNVRKLHVQDGAHNDPEFDLVLIIQPCNERCFVTW
jgi:hypothetical protein